MTTPSELRLAAERVRQYNECLGGSGSPYRGDDVHSLVNDELLICDAIIDRLDSHYILGYMDKIDYEYELGQADGGIVVFSSVEDLLANKHCARRCGIVEVEVRLVRVAVEPKEDQADH